MQCTIIRKRIHVFRCIVLHYYITWLRIWFLKLCRVEMCPIKNLKWHNFNQTLKINWTQCLLPDWYINSNFQYSIWSWQVRRCITTWTDNSSLDSIVYVKLSILTHQNTKHIPNFGLCKLMNISESKNLLFNWFLPNLKTCYNIVLSEVAKNCLGKWCIFV